MHLLSLSQLRACLGMQIVACCASIFNIILSMVKMDITPSHCWTWNRHENFTLYYGKACSNIEVSFFLNLMSFVAGVALNKPNWIWDVWIFFISHAVYTFNIYGCFLLPRQKALFIWSVQISFLHLLYLQKTQNHFFAESVIIQVTLIAIAVTLAAYCCKVVHCCAPAPKMVNHY